MDKRQTIDVLNRLLSLESSSLLGHLADSGFFVTRLTTNDYEAIRRIVADEREHLRWLSEAIMTMRGSIRPPGADSSVAGYHYWDLSNLMPKIVESKKRLAGEYAAVATGVGDAAASACIARIHARHQVHLDTLLRLDAASKQAV